MKKLKALLVILSFSLLACNGILRLNQKTFNTATRKTKKISEWQTLRFGAFVHFNDNTFIGKELSKNIDPTVFNPVKLDFDSLMSIFQKAGIKYAVLTTRHTSGFCLWDSKTTQFDVASSPYKKDVVRMFVDACRKHNIKPCLYYCLWGNYWKPWEWNPTIKAELKNTTPKEVIKAQLSELAENYGDIYEFWLDMQCWAYTTLKPQETYNLIKSKNPKTIIHFNQQVQNGTEIKYFPTDILNGEERIPPIAGHQPFRIIGNVTYYLPFEYEITSQRCDKLSLGNGLMKGSVWFTHTESHFYPVDSLYRYIKMNFERGGNNILLSTAPDMTGTYKKADADSIIKLGKLIWNKK
ncbi:MAG: alpha-L-fucosidase [Bacteroidetes bacterium]|nr:alpha-L-fucosidase [Bacteroidota bacterium]